MRDKLAESKSKSLIFNFVFSSMTSPPAKHENVRINFPIDLTVA